MPLSSSVLSAAMRAAILASEAKGVDGPELTALCDAISEAVVAHLVANALVIPSALVAPTGGGPVTGVGTIQ